MKTIICDICGERITGKASHYKTIVYLYKSTGFNSEKKKLDICWECSYKIRAFCQKNT